MEDIVNNSESPPEIQPVSCLPNTLQNPEKTYKPSPKLLNTFQVRCPRREKHFFSHLMFLQSVVLFEVVLLALLGPLEMILSLVDKLLDVLYKVSSS